MKAKSKVWLDSQGELVFGIGKSGILKVVEKTGSLNSAAKQLNMSYRHAWSYVRSAEKRLGKQLLIKIKGGKSGGGALLTDYAKNLVKKFDTLEHDSQQFVDKRFKEIFQSDGNL